MRCFVVQCVPEMQGEKILAIAFKEISTEIIPRVGDEYCSSDSFAKLAKVTRVVFRPYPESGESFDYICVVLSDFDHSGRYRNDYAEMSVSESVRDEFFKDAFHDNGWSTYQLDNENPHENLSDLNAAREGSLYFVEVDADDDLPPNDNKLYEGHAAVVNGQFIALEDFKPVN